MDFKSTGSIEYLEDLKKELRCFIKRINGYYGLRGIYPQQANFPKILKEEYRNDQKALQRVIDIIYTLKSQ